MPARVAADPALTFPPVHRTGWGLAVKVALALAALALLAWIWLRWIEPHAASFERWIEALGGWAPPIFIVSFALATSIFLPKSMLSMAGGAIFGPLWGTVWVMSGSVVAGTVVFLAGRHLLRERVTRSLAKHPTLVAIDAAIARRGMRLVVLLRVAPISFAAMNWLLSASRISFPTFLVGCVGLVPGTLSTVLIGFAARHTAELATRAAGGDPIARGDSIAREIAVYSGVAASLLVTVVVTRIAVKAVHEATAAEPSASPATGDG
jgi:uncharacterized membrane protein YdjX (TVP38/TMEM64 family)